MATKIINSLTLSDTYVFSLPYGTCQTAAGTAAKVVSVDKFVLETGAQILVKFTYANTASSATLNVNSTGAKSIYYKGSAISNGSYIRAGEIYQFLYSGSQWEIVGAVIDASAGDSNTPVYFSNGQPVACTGLDLNTTGSAAKWTTARTLTVGSTGKSVDGSGNVSWSHAEIGATVSNTWTNGTSAGPTIKTTVNGVAGSAVAIPAASETYSGVVTTSSQSFAGAKTFTSNLTVGSSAHGVITSTDGTVTLGVKTDGGWSRGIYMKQTSTSNTSKNTGGIGWYGSGATCNYFWVGTGYESPWFYVTPSGYAYATRVYGAVWNDYAEFRNQDSEIKPGYCVASTNSGKVYKTTEHLQACDGIVSDTYGFSIGKTDECKTPLAVSGRVLAYCEGDAHDYNAGDTVGASANGKVIKMTREEIKEYPDRIVGIVSEIPEYETWGTGKVNVDGRIWIKVK